MNKVLRLAIDGNEANVPQRVGSNVYAFEVIKQLWRLTANQRKFHCVVLLSQPPVADLPAVRPNWQYKVLKPRRLWTQWALPLHLFWSRKSYDVLYTPGHYAPRWSTIPYVSSVMDLAFLSFPEQFEKNDLFQLKNWTAYSVKNASKVIAISQFTKQSVNETYDKPLKDIVVASPAASLPTSYSPLRAKAFFRKHGIMEKNYLLYLGTLQPRKNLINLVEAFEIFSRFHAANQLKKRTAGDDSQPVPPPQLVLAGKIGWLAQSLLDRVAASPLKNQIILTGFIDDSLRRPLYERARATVLIGLSEGFGLPALESLSAGTMPVVSNSSSLPEVVGNVGLTVDPEQPQAIANALKKAWNLPANDQPNWLKRAQKQTQQFSWENTGKTILNTLVRVAKDAKKR